jgi:hypothetical protein
VKGIHIKLQKIERPSDFMQLMILYSQPLINNLLILVWRNLFITRTGGSTEEILPQRYFWPLIININTAAIYKCEWEISSTKECKVLKFCMAADL